LLGLGDVCAVFGQTASGETTGIAPAERCVDLLILEIEGLSLAISKADAVPTTPPGTVRASPFSPEPISVAIPSYCRVDGMIDQRTGVDGKTYRIGFAIALPDNWNGRFLFQAGGGPNGFIGDPFGSAAAGKVPGLARGFAVVATDTGHQGQVFDSTFMKDQLTGLDFDSSPSAASRSSPRRLSPGITGNPPGIPIRRMLDQRARRPATRQVRRRWVRDKARNCLRMAL
jgi:hypothetical protein